ncbi:cytochrome P450 [Nonomuraea sp. MG754425]|uniref:cytochrome P450 n=1 Tax=Nonomuraea sp. MG754425 TaxID=2570319 RepID=UPI001F2F6794|nr:cytochrome P450 [Nonomuraea sp. MG754425]MCF6475692.1 cytochrome P450 [Nonomuraea sp. MG754425]
MDTSQTIVRQPADLPGAWPLLGHIVPILRRPLEFLPAASGHGDVVKVRFGRLPVYVVTHPAAVRDVLVPGDLDYRRGRIFDRLEPALGKGIATVSGSEHRRLRRLLQPVFTRERLSGYAAVMRTAAEECTASWRDGQTLAVDEVMNDLALTALTRSLFNVTAHPATAEAVKHGMRLLTHGLLLRTVLPPAWERLPTPGNLRFRRATAAMHAAVDDVIAAYRAAGGDRGDVLSALLGARDDDGHGLSDQEVHAQVTTLALTGVEAPGAVLGWVLYEIGRDPAVAARVEAEIDAVLGDRPPGFDDLPALDYLGRVVEETLRLRTPLVFMRRTLTDVRVGGSVIPAGAEVIYSPYLLHHDARWFPDPSRFDPDRWLPENRERIPKGAYIPFAAGAYQCIGKLFATMELTVVTAAICARWRLRPVPGTRVREVATALVRPDRLPMTAHRRERAAGPR